MKIGIISQFAYDNYGNKLQNFALQQVLLQSAESVITIKNRMQANNCITWLKEYSAIAEAAWLHRLLGKNRKAEFIRFHKKNIYDGQNNYCVKQSYTSLQGSDKCMLYCSGSDQVWKPMSGRCGIFHYLGFAEYDRTFSYAASFGIDHIPTEYEDSVREGLKHIKFLSVREDGGKRIVEELTGRTDVQVHVDPTMLLTPEEWDKVSAKPKHPVPEKYMLTYFLGSLSPERKVAMKNRAKELGCEIVALMDKEGPYYNNGPAEFLWLIKHARLVCTDSFHGSVFSFLYGKPLLIFDRAGSGENMSSRLETLTAKFALQDYMVRGNALPEVPEKPDYSRGYAVLEEERARSKAYFDMVFQEAERIGLIK